MRPSTFVAGLAAAAAPAFAQNMSICDKYTTALLKENTGENQLTLLTLLVNTVVIGNYTQPNMNAVPGILAKGMYNGTEVNLLPYFNGGLASSNRGGSSGVSINFLDDGGATPLMMNKPANGTSSNQYKLLTHLYQYFGALLGCSATGFPSYAGFGSQASVHRFMDLSAAEVGYFIEQVALAAASFGVSQDDIATVGKALNSIFNVRCAPPTTVIPAQGAQLQSICQDETCPLAPMPTCAAYPATMKPAKANSTMSGSGSMSNGTMGGSGSMASGSMTASAKPSAYTGAAAKVGAGAAGVLALAALAL
ncbi:hypothetical protein KCU81_g2975, partial [Aureobasidium melanogenum]|uniref:Heme haloperoxidase family profile domain-containing protein n=1 Tax=Aureobasidium melanogenum (strain CBS 110374) TaxID=1043003 RepID=A0A074VM55_AURM1